VANDAQTAIPVAKYKALLEQERSTLARQLAELGFGGASDTGLAYDANFADSSQVTAERSEAEALASELRSSLAEVERALERVEAGTYGTCLRCGKPIAPARLEAKPAVTTCISCASLPR
jgi:RNA polymerase-binding transcription factor DksA